MTCAGFAGPACSIARPKGCCPRSVRCEKTAGLRTTASGLQCGTRAPRQQLSLARVAPQQVATLTQMGGGPPTARARQKKSFAASPHVTVSNSVRVSS